MLDAILKIRGSGTWVDIESIDDEIDAVLADMVESDFPFRKVKEMKLAGKGTVKVVYLRNMLGRWYSFAYDERTRVLVYSVQQIVTTQGWRKRWTNEMTRTGGAAPH